MKISKCLRYFGMASAVDVENAGTTSTLPPSLQHLLDETDESEREELCVDRIPSAEQPRRWESFVFDADEIVCNGVKLFVILAALYLVWEIVPAFLPGGAVDQVLGGAR
jgi:hypothetical protein